MPGKNNGMFGLKPDVIMRTKENPNMEIDWETFDSLNRTELQMKSVKDIVDVRGPNYYIFGRENTGFYLVSCRLLFSHC